VIAGVGPGVKGYGRAAGGIWREVNDFGEPSEWAGGSEAAGGGPASGTFNLRAEQPPCQSARQAPNGCFGRVQI